MTKNEIDILLEKQRKFFNTNKTKDVSFRLETLNKLYQIILNNEDSIIKALYDDLHKGDTEAYSSEILFSINDLKYIFKNLKKWSKKQKIFTHFINQPGTSYYQNEPFGISLIIGPWNYPFGLIMSPLFGAISAGNCAILKPSEITENTSKLIAELINSNFPEDYIRVVEGGAEVTQLLINEKIDYVFFTGSTQVGKIIMKSAAEYLLPVTLELGGKNPCIVDKDIDLDVTVNRILWGKFFNAGQTCIAPDYLIVHSEIKDKFNEKMKQNLDKFYPNINHENKDFTHIVNTRNFERLEKILSQGEIIFGGEKDKEHLFISPTLIVNPDMNSEIMTDEIFGPILPITFYDDLNKVITDLKNKPKPLTLYFFSNDKRNQDKIANETSSGSVCINGTIHVIFDNKLPFGGVGMSGLGNYHGKWSFETFSHKKAIVKKSFSFDMKQMYPPYKVNLAMLKKIIKWFY